VKEAAEFAREAIRPWDRTGGTRETHISPIPGTNLSSIEERFGARVYLEERRQADSWKF
jgi:hypothetical protein